MSNSLLTTTDLSISYGAVKAVGEEPQQQQQQQQAATGGGVGAITGGAGTGAPLRIHI